MLFFVGLAGAIALAQTIGLTAAEGLLLARLGAERLPLGFVVASGFTMLAALVYARRVGEARNDLVLIELVAVAVAGALALSVAVAVEWPYAPLLLLCLQVAAQAILGNHFFAFAADFFDRLAAKRVMPLFTAGTSLGASAGGFIAFGLSHAAPPAALVLGWALGLAAVAMLLRISRPSLRRWAPLGVEEDASSLEGVRAAARYLRIAPLGRALLLGTVVMVTATHVARYLYSGTLAQAFPDEESLTRFLGLYLGVSNLAEIAIPLWIGPWLIQRIGVPVASLLHPVLTLASSVGLAASAGLPAALVARANGELLESAFAAPVRNLVSDALPLRFRARAQAFLDGVVVYAALSVAGAMLLLARPVDREGLAAIAVALAALYLLLQLAVRRRFVDAVVGELRAGRLDLEAVGRELGRREVSRLAVLWEHVLRQEGPGAARPLLELAPFLAARGFTDAVRVGLDHARPDVRVACVDALAGAARLGPAHRLGLAERMLGDTSAEVRLAALRALPEDGGPAAAALARRHLDDPAPEVAAASAIVLGAEGEARLRALARSATAADAEAAFAVLPEALAAEAEARVSDPAPAVRAAALGWLARHPAVARRSEADLAPAIVDALSDRDAGVRREAVSALLAAAGARGVPRALEALGDDAAGVRAAAVSGLAPFEAEAITGARAWLRRPSPPGPKESAIELLAAVESPGARAALLLELRDRVHEAWEALLALRALPERGDLRLRFLRAAEMDALAGALRLVFHVLQRVEDPAVVRTVEHTLRFGPRRLHFDALEVLSHLGEREAAARLVLLLEPVALEEKAHTLAGFLSPPRSPDEVRDRAREGPTPWLRWAAALAEGTRDGAKEHRMERLVFLREVPLFSNLGLEQLEAIERIAREEEYMADEEVVREGDPGEELYLVMSGSLAVWSGWRSPTPVRLNALGPGSYFGEMAILDRAPRSASVVANEPSRLLVLDGSPLRDLIFQRPEIAFEVFRVLTARVRAAEARLRGAA